MRRVHMVALVMLIACLVGGNVHAEDSLKDEIEELKQIIILYQSQIQELAAANKLLEQRLELLEDLEKHPAFRHASLYQQLDYFESAVNSLLKKGEHDLLNSMILEPISPGDVRITNLAFLAPFKIDRSEIRIGQDGSEAQVTIHFLVTKQGMPSVHHSRFRASYGDYRWMLDLAEFIESIETCAEH